MPNHMIWKWHNEYVLCERKSTTEMIRIALKRKNAKRILVFFIFKVLTLNIFTNRWQIQEQ